MTPSRSLNPPNCSPFEPFFVDTFGTKQPSRNTGCAGVSIQVWAETGGSTTPKNPAGSKEQWVTPVFSLQNQGEPNFPPVCFHVKTNPQKGLGRLSTDSERLHLGRARKQRLTLIFAQVSGHKIIRLQMQLLSSTFYMQLHVPFVPFAGFETNTTDGQSIFKRFGFLKGLEI